MNKIIYIILVATVTGYQLLGQSNQLQITYNLYNSVTKEPIREDEGVTVTCNYTYLNLVCDMSRYSLFFGGYIYNFHTQLLQNYFNEPVGGTFIFSRKNVTSFSITFSGPTYESFNHMGTFCQTYKGQSFFEDDGGADNYWAAEKVINEQINCLIPDNYGTKLIYLNPKNTVISGTLNINAQSHLNNQSTQFTTSTNNKDIELGVYSSKEIAQKLRVSEEDILKLIRTGELRAKKIGEHYFIRKEDFDEYIRK